MPSGLESAINEMLAELDKQKHELAQLQGGMGEVAGTATSPRKQISVTVDGRGEITELKFRGNSYRAMPSEELANLIIQTISEARKAAQARVSERLGTHFPGGAELAQAGTDTDWSSAFGEALTLPPALMDLLRSSPTDPFEGPDDRTQNDRTPDDH